MRTGLRRGALRLDLEDLATAERAAMRANLVRRLGTPALRTRHEILRFQRKMAAALALSGMRDPFLGLTCQMSLSFDVGAKPRRPTLGIRPDCTGWSRLNVWR
jgi:hypothetical protein